MIKRYPDNYTKYSSISYARHDKRAVRYGKLSVDET